MQKSIISNNNNGQKIYTYIKSLSSSFLLDWEIGVNEGLWVGHVVGAAVGVSVGVLLGDCVGKGDGLGVGLGEGLGEGLFNPEDLSLAQGTWNPMPQFQPPDPPPDNPTGGSKDKKRTKIFVKRR